MWSASSETEYIEYAAEVWWTRGHSTSKLESTHMRVGRRFGGGGGGGDREI